MLPTNSAKQQKKKKQKKNNPLNEIGYGNIQGDNQQVAG